MTTRLSRIVTRTGDDGSTALGNGVRVSKADARVCVFGTVDELNSHLGLLRAFLQAPSAPPTSPEQQADLAELDAVLSQRQHECFDLGGELCIPGHRQLADASLLQLEQEIHLWNAQLPPLANFILPAGSTAIAQAHVCRTVCRRAEREVVALKAVDATLSDTVVQYLNRLSDWLFVLSRHIGRIQGTPPVIWQQRHGWQPES